MVKDWGGGQSSSSQGCGIFLVFLRRWSNNGQAYLPNIADSAMLNEVSQIVLKIDFVFVIGTTLFQFSLKITPDSRFVSSVVCFPFCRCYCGDSNDR
jgi:hypothetical protein